MTDTMKSKTVAVVMCTYNGEKYLREQLGIPFSHRLILYMNL